MFHLMWRMAPLGGRHPHLSLYSRDMSVSDLEETLARTMIYLWIVTVKCSKYCGSVYTTRLHIATAS